jgi:hypothetical protein
MFVGIAGESGSSSRVFKIKGQRFWNVCNVLIDVIKVVWNRLWGSMA